MKYVAFIMTVCFLVAACATPPPITVDEALATGEEEKLLWRRALEEQQVINTDLKAFFDLS